MEMLRFCCTVQPIWARILERHRAITGAAYADDAYLMGKLKEALFALADAIGSFSNDADADSVDQVQNLHAWSS